MTFEQMVRDYERLKYQIRRLEIKEKELRLLGGFPKPSMLDGMPKTKNNNSSIENTLIKLSEIESQRNTCEIQLEACRRQILTFIDLSSSLMSREIIELKTFTPRCTWKSVANKVFLSEDYCRHLYYDGITEINKKLTKENKYEV